MPSSPSIDDRKKYLNELYAKCEAAEKEILSQANIDLRRMLASEIYFDSPLFGSNPELDAPLLNSDSDDLNDKKLIWRGLKYDTLISKIRKAKTREEKWDVLGRWCRQEKAVRPDELLPPDYVEGLLRKFPPEKAARGKLRPDYLRLAVLVRKWMPYFEELMRDKKRIEQSKQSRVKEELERMGYQPMAVAAALLSRRSATEAACIFLEMRGLGTANNASNAYSAIFPTRRKKRP